jgi:GntR family transcriptional repressor for pyruvate dehydrogenase complex
MKIKKTSLSDEIADSIKNSIKEGEWKLKEKLPSENELSEMFGVNRLTVRMALQKLSSQGIVETRVGEGTYVKDFSFRKYIEEVSDFYLKPEMIDNVCEFRKSLEVECARLAMERSSLEEIKALETACDRYDEVCSRLFLHSELDADILEELIDKDLEFHQEIVLLSKNELYKYSFEVAREPITRYLHIIVIGRMKMNANSRDLLIKACSQHRMIYEAIRDKKFEICKSAIIKMIDYAAEI